MCVLSIKVPIQKSFEIYLMIHVNVKTICAKEPHWYYLTHNWRNLCVHNFPKGISQKVNIRA